MEYRWRRGIRRRAQMVVRNQGRPITLSTRNLRGYRRAETDIMVGKEIFARIPRKYKRRIDKPIKRLRRHAARCNISRTLH